MVNMNEFTRQITLKEGKKISISKGQVDEVVRLTMLRLAKQKDTEIWGLIEKYRKIAFNAKKKKLLDGLKKKKKRRN